jgi:hypothetical protein
VYATLYSPGDRPATSGVLVCPSWGSEGRHLIEWTHRLAHAAASSGAAALLPQWPGTQDSDGDPEAVTFDRLVEAGRDSIAAVSAVTGALRWGLAGVRIGASAAALLAPEVDAPWLLLAQPALDPAAYFDAIERSARRSSLGAAPPKGWAFGHPLPAGLRGPEDGARVSEALDAFRGRGAVVRYRRPPDGPVPSGFELVRSWGDWRRPPRHDHSVLLADCRRWMRRALPRTR